MLDEHNMALFRDGRRSAGRVYEAGGRFTGFWDEKPVANGDDGEDIARRVEYETRCRMWIPDRSGKEGRA